ncbi:DUF3040 domain-containing protein [Streptomyces sp. NPDC012769]|uniref:DUF3040 domain-containing protein n=1 Tax=Streptomyces sp. NPDC012769 TaxID=3364848 RepID=UPI0036890963
MEEARLSARERRILAEIEEALRRDETLDRRLRSMRRGRRGVPRRLLPLGVALAFAGAAVLVVPANATGRAAYVWAFAAAWVTALAGLTVLVVRWCRRWAASRPDEWNGRDE